MGATSGDIEFRMLRGALTVTHIKVPVYGGQLAIERLFLKGNPSTITDDKPLLQQIVIQNLSYNAASLMQSWRDITLALPTSIDKLLQHTKLILIQDGQIINVTGLPTVHLTEASISGPEQQRKLFGKGHIGTTSSQWEIEHLFPSSQTTHQGYFSSNFQDIITHAYWSGTWHQGNLNIRLEQSSQLSDASLNIDASQNKQAWQTKFEANAWNINYPDFQTYLTGKGEITGTPKQWELSSNALEWNDTTFNQKHFSAAHISGKNIRADSSSKNVNINELDISDASMQFETSNIINLDSVWKFNVSNLTLSNLSTNLLIQQRSVKLPSLFGTAKVSNSVLDFDVSTQVSIQNAEHQFLRLQGSSDDVIAVSASDTPLVQLRNLLPYPIHEKAISVLGNTSLNLKVHPKQNWHTTGQVEVSDVHLSSETQNFKAQQLTLDIQNADNIGMHQANLAAKDWLVLFPLTPLQAWSENSNLDEWADIPWSIQQLNFIDGKIALGHEQQIWLDNAQLELKNWQNKQDAHISLSGLFGLEPLQASMVLTPGQDGSMQWQAIDINTHHANLFSLSEWFNLSQLPAIEKGHLSLSLKVNKELEQVHGRANMTINNLRVSEGASLPTNLSHLLNNTPELTLNIPFQGQGDWATLFAQALVNETSSQSEKNHVTNPETKLLGSLRIHQSKGLTQNERSRLRKMIKQAKYQPAWHIELTPDLGTAELSPALQEQIYNTQLMIKSFISARGIKSKNIYIVMAQEKHQSTSSAGAIHVNLVK